MADRQMGPGERATRSRSRRIIGTLATLFVGGLTVGLVASQVENPAPGGGIGTFPPTFVIAAVVSFLALVIGGSWIYFRSIDELERRNNYVGAVWGTNIYLTVYPAWWMLWKGGLASEPIHEILFFIMMIGTMSAYAWHKYRY